MGGAGGSMATRTNSPAATSTRLSAPARPAQLMATLREPTETVGRCRWAWCLPADRRRGRRSRRRRWSSAMRRLDRAASRPWPRRPAMRGVGPGLGEVAIHRLQCRGIIEQLIFRLPDVVEHVGARPDGVGLLELDQRAAEITVGVELDAALKMLARLARRIVGERDIGAYQNGYDSERYRLHFSSPYGLWVSMLRFRGGSHSPRG